VPAINPANKDLARVILEDRLCFSNQVIKKLFCRKLQKLWKRQPNFFLSFLSKYNHFPILDLGQHFQVGLVSGGVSRCGDKNVPSYFTRLDYPEIATFIADPENKATTGNINTKPMFFNRLVTNNYKRIVGLKRQIQKGLINTINFFWIRTMIHNS
jgi:hypothetical protein